MASWMSGANRCWADVILAAGGVFLGMKADDDDGNEEDAIAADDVCEGGIVDGGVDEVEMIVVVFDGCEVEMFCCRGGELFSVDEFRGETTWCEGNIDDDDDDKGGRLECCRVAAFMGDSGGVDDEFAEEKCCCCCCCGEDIIATPTSVVSSWFSVELTILFFRADEEATD